MSLFKQEFGAVTEMFSTTWILTVVTKTMTEMVHKFKLWLLRETWTVDVQQKLGLWQLCKIWTSIAL